MDWNAWAIIIGFIGGAIITVIATLIIVRWQRDRKELSYRTEVRPFIAPQVPGKPWARWDPNVKVFYRDKEVRQLFPFKIIFRNTGNQTLEKLLISLKSNKGAQILSLMIGRAKDVEVGGTRFVDTRKPEERVVEIGFLNESDEILAYGIGTSEDIFELTITVPQPGVRVRNRPEFWTSREALRKGLEILVKMISRP